jgi:outer membrane receptor for ferric coprogen and ferric-rhodotorulic acid
VDYAQGLVDDTVTFTPGSSSKGFEASMQYQPMRNFQAILSYAHTRAIILPGDPNPATAYNPLVYSVPDAVTLFARYTFLGGPLNSLIVGGGFVQNWGPIYVDSPATSGLANRHGYFTANAFVRYPLKIAGHRVGLQVGANNITDDRYMMNGGYSSPREVILSADIKF